MPGIASTANPFVSILAVVALLVLVLVGIRDEERHMSLTSAPRTRIGAITRHLTGVGVRTPGADPGSDHDSRSERDLP
jgi:hypothetical protein